MNLNKLTERAQEAVATAQQQAEERNHGAVDVDHLLLALVEQRDGVVPQILQKLGVSPERIREEMHQGLSRCPTVSGAVPGRT